MITQAIRPTLFSVTARPELIIAILYTHLMSERLWQLGEEISKHSGRPSSQEALAKRMARIHQFVNGRFYHAPPMEFARLWGLHERENIKDREDLDANDYAMDVLTKGFERRKDFESSAPVLLDFLKMGFFPEYVYPTLDVVLAHGARLRHLPNRPLGMTSCVDECILIAALALATQSCNLDDILFLGSPFHYSLFLFPDGNEGFWFNAKRELFDEGAWRSQCHQGSVSDRREAFERRMLIFDRLITPEGYCVFPKGQMTISKKRMEILIERLGGFLGLHMEQMLPELDRCMECAEALDNSETRTIAGPCASSAEIREQLRNLTADDTNTVAHASSYTFRSLDVPNPEAYVKAALSGYKTYIRAAEVSDLDDALSLVRNIPGKVSILQGLDRIALPDEVLFFQTASDNERVLLLYTLLTHSPYSEIEKADIQATAGGLPWMVRYGGMDFTGSDLRSP